jgi:hypothetical protein
MSEGNAQVAPGHAVPGLRASLRRNEALEIGVTDKLGNLSRRVRDVKDVRRHGGIDGRHHGVQRSAQH